MPFSSLCHFLWTHSIFSFKYCLFDYNISRHHCFCFIIWGAFFFFGFWMFLDLEVCFLPNWGDISPLFILLVFSFFFFLVPLSLLYFWDSFYMDIDIMDLILSHKSLKLCLFCLFISLSSFQTVFIIMSSVPLISSAVFSDLLVNQINQFFI